MPGPFDLLRADHIGSLRRPDALKDAQARFDRGEALEAEVTAAEDKAIREVVARHDAIGFPVATDGEFRRRNFQDSFADSVTGYDIPEEAAGFSQRMEAEKGKGYERVPSGLAVAGPAVVTRRPTAAKLKLTRNVLVDEYRFATGLTKTPVKTTLIGPDRVAQRFDWQASTSVYGGLYEFEDHVAEIQRRMVQEVVDAGCAYVQIDAPGYTAYVDGPSLETMRSRGEDPAENMTRSIAADNAVIDGIGGVTFGIHLCRGNSRAIDPKTGEYIPQWHREGAYDDIAEELFNELHHTRLLLEYDSDRSGDFTPLRFVPDDKVVVLGLVTTKTLGIEKVDDLMRRIDEAARFVPVERLSLSPQCGFSSGVLDSLPEDVQWRKLEVVLETAQRVWGTT